MIKITSCAIVKILLYTMYGDKLKTFVSSASLLLLFKKGLRSKTKYKTTFIRISAVQFESFFKHVRLWLISILFNGQSLKWLNVSAPDNVNCRTHLLLISSLWTITLAIYQKWFYHHSICFSSNRRQVAQRACNGSWLLNVDSMGNLSFTLYITFYFDSWFVENHHSTS